MKQFFLAVFMVIAVSAESAISAEVVTGPATVRDDVTVAIGGARYRLHGVAAAEGKSCGGDPCAKAAMSALDGWIAGAPVACENLARLGHGFYLARCRSASGLDLGERLLAEGLVGEGEGADASYRAALEGAKAARKGQWAQ